MPIQCPECKTMNRKTNNYCKKCGYELRPNFDGNIFRNYKDPFRKR
jgi:predicted amidophosphoribosyltransferase